MNFNRKQSIGPYISPKRALVVYGPRRVGKTTLLKKYLSEHQNEKSLYVVGDDIALRTIFRTESQKEILDLVRPYQVIGIDEAQQVPHVGIGAKMIIDSFPEKKLILTGSSSFDLQREVGEPLTGRHFTLTILPLAQSEIDADRLTLMRSIDDFLIYGSYPEVLSAPDHFTRVRILSELVSSYLFKDVLALDRIKSPDLLLDITKCIAFQIGREVSVNEIAKMVKADVKTVGRYLDLLEKMFVIKKIRGFSRNLRNEISKKAKYYFIDNGIRNAVIGNFNSLSLRDDIGGLWENFIFIELHKKSGLDQALDTYYFWRTHTGKEIDIIKESNGEITATEVKWSEKSVSAPKEWLEAYPKASFRIINNKNYLDFLL